jgi:hypothetical protein
MLLDKNTLMGGIVLLGLYIFVVQTLPTALATAGLSIAIYAITGSEGIVLAFMLATLFVKQYNNLFKGPEPVGIESFQVKDAPSIHARLEQVRTTEPLGPKVQTITGVLESPNILDNMPLQAMDQMMKDGVPCTSIPASAKARVLIYPKTEGFVPARDGSIENTMREAPYLQGGMDNEGINDALAHDISETPEPEIGGAEFASSEPMPNV